jgi:hypothetical protein
MPARYYTALGVHKKTMNCCGCRGAKRSSANIIERTPLSKRRNQLAADDADRSGKDGAAKTGRTWQRSMTRNSRRAKQSESLNAASLAFTSGAVPRRRRLRSCNRNIRIIEG